MAGSFEVKVRGACHNSEFIVLMFASGRQHLGALFNLAAYYVLALPVGLSLAFYSKIYSGLEGLWIGM